MAAAGGARAAEEGPFSPHPRWKFVFVNHVTSNPFFVPCQYGIQDACALLGVDYQWTGSETSDVAQMVNAFNAAVAGSTVVSLSAAPALRPTPGRRIPEKAGALPTRICSIRGIE